MFLIGHSWGSALGLLYTNKFPENVYAYIGTGQTVKVADGELISYKYTLKKAYESGNKQAITVRERIELKCVLQRGVRAWACSFLFIVNCIRKSTRF